MNSRILVAPLLALAAAACSSRSEAPLPLGDTRAKAAGSERPVFAGTADPGMLTLPEVAERATPAVVNISSTRLVRGGPEAMPFMDEPFFEHFFRQFPQEPPERRERSLGSGVIVSPDGVILTNNHVVAQADDIRITLADGRQLEAQIEGTDPKSDLAVLRVQGGHRDLPYLPFGDSDSLRLADVVLAIGNPFGVGQTVTLGIVSAVGRADVGIVDYEDFIQTDAAINPGNSGGALVNLRGELVGINTAIVTRTGGYMGIGFAIPSRMASPIMQALLEHGQVDRGWLGVVIQDLTPELAEALAVDSTRGVLVADVVPQGPAARAGLQPRDIVLAVDGEEVTSSGHLRNIIAAKGAKARVELHIRRGQMERRLSASLTELPSEEPPAPEPTERPTAALGGIAAVELSPDLRARLQLPAEVNGVVVASIEPDSAADRAGLRPGDVVTQIDRRDVTNSAELRGAYAAAGERMLIRVWRGGAFLYVALQKSQG